MTDYDETSGFPSSAYGSRSGQVPQTPGFALGPGYYLPEPRRAAEIPGLEDGEPGGPLTAGRARRLTRGTLAAACASACLAQVALAIPAVNNGLFQQDLGTSSIQLIWISDAFLLPAALLELTFGVLGDLFGRKRLLVIGALLIALGELIGLLTPGPQTSAGTRVLFLWTAQAVAGLGTAALFPTSLAMVAVGTHTPRSRSRGISLWAASLASGGIISPVLGGWLDRYRFGGDVYGSWRWSNLVIMALAVGVAVVIATVAKSSSAPEGRSLDLPGQVTVAVAVFALLFAVVQASSDGWTARPVLTGFGVAALFLAAFVAVERRAPSPLLRLDLFADRAFAVAAVTTLAGMLAVLGTNYLVGTRLAAVQGASPLRTAVAFVMLNGMSPLLLPVTWRVLVWYDPRWILGAAFGLVATGNFWLATVPASDTSYTPLAVPLLLTGAGFALGLAAVSAIAVNSVPENLAGMASGTASMLRDVGFTLGPAVIGAITLRNAAAAITAKVAGSPALSRALAAFNAAPEHAPAAQQAALRSAVAAVNSGPLGANAVPASTGTGGHTVPLNPVHDVAFQALGSAYAGGFVICGAVALAAALLAMVALRGLDRQRGRHRQGTGDAMIGTAPYWPAM